MIEYGLQMYSVRDITKENLKDALRQVAEMGYKYVEFAGFFGNTAEDVKALLAHIQKIVYENSGVLLEPEIRVL
jgi:UDP-N-acetylenolpyruvoylglucosamine reductase